jgi:hypothetical protein
VIFTQKTDEKSSKSAPGNPRAESLRIVETGTWCAGVWIRRIAICGSVSYGI